MFYVWLFFCVRARPKRKQHWIMDGLLFKYALPVFLIFASETHWSDECLGVAAKNWRQVWIFLNDVFLVTVVISKETGFAITGNSFIRLSHAIVEVDNRKRNNRRNSFKCNKNQFVPSNDGTCVMSKNIKLASLTNT